MSRPMQKMILTATYTTSGNVHLDIDFYPPMPESNEEFAKLSEIKKQLVAIINRFGKENIRMLEEITKMGDENAPELPMRDAVQNADSGSAAPAQLPGDVQEEKKSA